MKIIEQQRSDVAKIVIYNDVKETIVFNCPGCNQNHELPVKGIGTVTWQWDGNINTPTLSPSILITGTKMTEKGEADYNQWYLDGCKSEGVSAFESVDTVCHSFLRNGKLEFLSDCTHELKGQTVSLPELF